MGNKPIPKVKINSEGIKSSIIKRGYSIRSTAQKIGISERSLRSYFKNGMMPIYVLDRINSVLFSSSTVNKSQLSAPVKKEEPAKLESPSYVYVVNKNIRYSNGNRSWHSRAFSSPSAAFSYILSIIKYCGCDIKWSFVSMDHTEIHIRGTGLFFDTPNKGNKDDPCEEGSCFITYSQIVLCTKEE